MLYKYSQLSDDKARLNYDETVKYSNVRFPHLGQLKLLYSEILFLNKYAEKGDLLIYVGAAEGSHIPMLYDLFKHLDLTFDLYDPNPFKQEKREKINLYNHLFTDETLEKYNKTDSKKILLTCDMRNTEISKYKGKTEKTKQSKDVAKMDDIVDEDK